MKAFFKKAFAEMKASAQAQHAVDKAMFAAVKAESRASFEETRAAGRPAAHQAMMQQERAQQLSEAQARKEAADTRIASAQRRKA